MKAIYKRELRAFFLTGIGYVFMGVFLALAGVIFYVNNLTTRSSDLGGFFTMVSYIWVLLAPILVMRLLAGERKKGTDQLLLTAPVSIGHIVAAKYLAALTILMLTLLISTIYPIIISIYGYIYLPEILSGYIGLLLYGSAFLALDMLVSSFARSPASAFVLAFGANLLVRMSGLLAKAVNVPAFSYVATLFDLDARYLPFVYGQLSLANAVYYTLFTLTVLVVSVQMLKIGRWNQA